MKEIKAIIQPFLLDRVLDALHEIEGLPGVTVSPAYAVSTASVSYEQIAKTKLEIIVPDALVDSVVRAIQINAHTGNSGDGGIFIIPVDVAVKIRTGKRSDAQGAMEANEATQ